MNFFGRSLVRNTLACFSQGRWLWHLLAIALSYLLVSSGFDWWWFASSRSWPILPLFFLAVILGALLPILAPLSFLALGQVTADRKLRWTGWALGQAALIGAFIAAVYKAFTGRLQPDLLNTATDLSRNFQFGFWRHGIFWGWPSSHTTIAFAMAITLIYLYSKNKWVLILAPLYALFIGVGVSTNIHWFSDFVAGAIIGSVVGVVVGHRFSAE